MRKKIEMQSIIESLTLEEGIEKWMNHCKRRGLTENSIKYYTDITNIFMQHISYKTNLSTINCNIIDTFISNLQDKGTKTTTINSYLNGIRSICNWWATQDYLKPFKIEKIKCDETIKDTFTQAKIK